MNDEQRIRALHEQGRLDAEQADRLLEALGSTSPEAPYAPEVPNPPEVPDAHDEMSDGVNDQTASEATGGTSSERPDPSDRPDFEGIRSWVAIELFACSIRVEVDEGLEAPVAEVRRGDVELQGSDDGWRVVQQGRGESWFERLASGAFGSKMELRLPARTGIRLDVKAGDVELVGVPALRGHLAAGDLDAVGLKAVDLDVKAGDVDLELNPNAGPHRVRLAVGDLEVRLPRDADVRVEGHVSIGDASAGAPLEATRVGLVAAALEGTLGQGRAQLRLEVGTGDLDVRLVGHGG